MIPTFGDAGMKSEKIKIDLHRKTGDFFKSLLLRKGTNLWVALRRFGVPIGSSCSGVGVCGKCAIRIDAAASTAVNAKTELEELTLQRQGLSSDLRLACLCRVHENINVQADYW